MIGKTNSGFKNIQSEIPKYLRNQLTSVIIPDDITVIPEYAFYGLSNLITVIMSDNVTDIGNYAFTHTGIKNISFPQNLKRIGDHAFDGYPLYNTLQDLEINLPNGLQTVGNQAFYGAKAKKIVFPGTVTSLGNYCMQFCAIESLVFSHGITKLSTDCNRNCDKLKYVFLPNTLTGHQGSFYGCMNLEYVTLETGYNGNGLNLSYSTKYSHDTILGWFNALYDRTGLTTNTLTIGSTNLAKMTAEEIAIATAKNWTLA